MSKRATESTGRSWRASFRLPAVGAVGLVGLALLASGCGGSSSNGVAQIGSSPASTTSSNSSPSSASSKGNPAAFSACMRKNGVRNFPDPDSNGRIRIESGRTASGQKFGVDVSSPQFRKAQKACQKLQPGGGKPDPKAQAKELQQMVRFAACMRSHGVPNFPDPQQGPGGGILMRMPKGINDDSAQFRAATKACEKLVPGSAFAGPTGPPPSK
jgi:hypothetical protein